MKYDVFARRLTKGRWHWYILGPLSEQAKCSDVVETCCSTPIKTGSCGGFDDEASAKADGWGRARELEAGDRSPTRT